MFLLGSIICIVIAIGLIKLSFELWKISLGLLLLIIFLGLICSPVKAYEYTPMDVVNIGKVVHHEAENQSELGKRLVIDTILNRVESGQFPDTVDGVLGQKGQYCNPDEFPPRDIYRLIAQEIYTRTNDQVLWYKTKDYHKYGEPIIQEGDHYFSGGSE